MSARLGLGVSAGEVRAVLVHDGRVIWHASRPLNGAETMEQALGMVLSAVPTRRFGRVRVIAALGPAAVQVKRLAGVPATTARSIVTQLARANAGRFFLRNGVPLAIAPAHRGGDAWWSAALDAPIVTAVESACGRAGLVLDGFVPAITAIAALTTNGHAEWYDGPVRASIDVRGGSWNHARRDRAEPAMHPTILPAIARLGTDGAAYADAFGAACSSARSPLFLRASPRPTGRAAMIARRSSFVAVAAAGLAGFVLAPGVAAVHYHGRDSVHLDALRAAMISWPSAARQLRETTDALDVIAGFGANRRSTVQLLGSLSRALPDSTAIVTLRVDSASGSMTLLSTSAAGVMSALAGMPHLESAAIVGTVTRERVAGVRVQRLTVGFRLRAERGADRAGQ